MDWRKSFAKLFNLSTEDVLAGDSYSQVLLFIFDNVTSPSLYISADGTLTVPPSYSIKVHSNTSSDIGSSKLIPSNRFHVSFNRLEVGTGLRYYFKKQIYF